MSRKSGSTRERVRTRSYTEYNLPRINTVRKNNFDSERRRKELHYDESYELICDFDVFVVDRNDNDPKRTFEILEKKCNPTVDDLYRHIYTRSSSIFKKILDNIEFVERSDLDAILIQLINLDFYDTDIYGKVKALINNIGVLDKRFLCFYDQYNNNLYKDRNVLLLCSRNGASLEYLFPRCKTVKDVNIVIDMGGDIYSSSMKVPFHHERMVRRLH